MISRRFSRALVAAPLALALGLAACGSGDDSTDDTASGASGAGFPVTITHAFGDTTIDDTPTRVVAWGWGSADAAIALDVVPVAIPFQSYGGDANGVLPWIAEKLDETGAEVPTVLPDAQEPPFDEIAAAEPDLILAVYSGIDQEQYDLLSRIAPTVAYPGEAWATPWRDLITTVGTALGKSTEAQALLDDIDAQIATKAQENPQLAGKSVAMVWDSAGTFYVYKEADPRVEFALDLGMTGAESVDALGTDESTFYFTMSYEQLDQLTSDVLVSFATTQEEQDAFLSSQAAQTMPQIQSGAVASLVGAEFIASVSPPTALSVTWGLDDYVAALAAAADKVDATS
ncbi:iron-siderophore ABC transporter substrate-binding protein [Micromonospora sp. NBC_01813]|uniref:iron-siderophore ABC transporter substrate-binding protein n=1 Tax=Micromonospora sp. NBC_01813 TaxID=2975988 RepID=UPI002DD98557|nr:iron-siderophore ABC transporter substrate-binding protein [Micromonospora sp. NBC_01813]WSA08713.1 iron-siderophore ABC transporter substrate-binding protein [Micromonospora sp. NBC_01813]